MWELCSQGRTNLSIQVQSNMLYQVSFGHSFNSLTIAQHFVEADTSDQAWAKGLALCPSREVVQEVRPVRTIE